jgi:hypothetical protein
LLAKGSTNQIKPKRNKNKKTLVCIVQTLRETLEKHQNITLPRPLTLPGLAHALTPWSMPTRTKRCARSCRLASRWQPGPTLLDFFSNFGPLMNLIPEMIPQIVFHFWPLWSHRMWWRVFELGPTKYPDVTHGHETIGCHVNLGGPASSFGTQNESGHADWCDSNMSHTTLLCVTHFGSKLVKSVFYHLTFFCY